MTLAYTSFSTIQRVRTRLKTKDEMKSIYCLIVPRINRKETKKRSEIICSHNIFVDIESWPVFEKGNRKLVFSQKHTRQIKPKHKL